uniref:Uncharacterized protein n=1 Tax=Proboscia inermis TaxID=420281 RepID=A0A6T8GBK2_9STRA|mmetsp:Transcript_16464/g.16641  ORF Transcript_16464/g.16641 Transcript_16464/m.16641 type:complete len:157 (+) Transcript_16464:242-712(+)
MAKPLAKRIKHDFSRYPSTQHIIVGIGQVSHQVTSRLKIMSAGYKVRSIKALEDEKALTVGADFLGESILFLVGGSIVVYEYNAGKEKERRKQEKIKLLAEEDERKFRMVIDGINLRLQKLENSVRNSHDQVRKQNKSQLIKAETETPKFSWIWPF